MSALGNILQFCSHRGWFTEFYLVARTNRLRIICWCLTNLLHVDESRACGPSAPLSYMYPDSSSSTHTHAHSWRTSAYVPSLIFLSRFSYPRGSFTSYRWKLLRDGAHYARQAESIKRTLRAVRAPGIIERESTTASARARALSTECAIRRNWRASNCST